MSEGEREMQCCGCFDGVVELESSLGLQKYRVRFWVRGAVGVRERTGVFVDRRARARKDVEDIVAGVGVLYVFYV